MRAAHEAGLLGRGVLVAGLPRQLGRLDVDLVRDVRELVVLLRDAGGAEGVGLHQVSAGGQVLLVDAADDLGPREHQQLVVPLYVDRVVGEARAAEVRLGELVALDHRAHRAIEDQDAAGEQLAQAGFSGRSSGSRG
jgi:hypothetical protein